jgi:hypothetical protein
MRALFAIPRRTDIQFHQFRRGLESFWRRQDANANADTETSHADAGKHACLPHLSIRSDALLALTSNEIEPAQLHARVLA